MTITLTTFSEYTKRRYDSARVMSSVSDQNPAWAMVKKVGGFDNETFHWAMEYSGAGHGRIFATVKSRRTHGRGKQFALTRTKDYSIAAIDTETYFSCKSGAALMDVMETAMNGCLRSLKRSLGISTYGDGSGAIGVIDQAGAGGGAGLATTTLYLADADDVTNYEVNQYVVFAQDTASALRNAGAALQVLGRDEDAGTLTMSANLNTIAGLADGDTIFNEGDYVSAADRLAPLGFSAYIPATAPVLGVDSFLGVDRGSDPVRMAGYRANDTSYPGYTTEEAIHLLCTKIYRGGTSYQPDTVFMGPVRFSNFIQGLGSKVEFSKKVPLTDGKGKMVAEVGFDGVRVHAGHSTVECFADPNCPEETVWVLKLDTWEFKYLGDGAPMAIPNPGSSSIWRTEDQADAIEARWGVWGNFRCKCAAANGRFDWA